MNTITATFGPISMEKATIDERKEAQTKIMRELQQEFCNHFWVVTKWYEGHSSEYYATEVECPNCGATADVGA